MYNYSVDPCGPIYVTVGDGGRSIREYTLHKKSDRNPESLSSEFIDGALESCVPCELRSRLSMLSNDCGYLNNKVLAIVSTDSTEGLLRAGNIEQLYTDWVDMPTSMCPPESVADCPTKQDGRFCPQKQPAWSAFR